MGDEDRTLLVEYAVTAMKRELYSGEGGKGGEGEHHGGPPPMTCDMKILESMFNDESI